MTKFLTTSIFILACSFMTFAQNTLSGNIKDKQGESLPFANVMLTHSYENGVKTPIKSQIGTTTDFDGDFILTGIPNGKFSVVAIYLGYKEQSFDVEFSDGVSNITKIIVLEDGSETLEEVVVTAQVKGQIKAINQQINARSIVNVVSADRIQQNPDANAAEAIGRLPGVTVTRNGGEANGIVVRGMQGYSNITINGVEVPVNLTSVSQFALQNVEVFKSINASMDASAPAGSVNLKLGTAPDTNSTSILAQAGYNDLNQTYQNYKINLNSSWRFFDKKFGVSLNLAAESTDRSTEQLIAGIAVGDQSVVEGEALQLQTNSVRLRDVNRTIKRNSAILTTDYRFSPSASIEWSNIVTHSPGGPLNVDKLYNGSAGLSFYALEDLTNNNTYNYSSILTAKHLLGRLKVDYSAAFGYANNHTELRNVSLYNLEAYEQTMTIEQMQTLSHREYVNLATMENTDESINEYALTGSPNAQPGLTFRDTDSENKNIDVRLNMELPYTIGSHISGGLKWGGRLEKTHFNQETYGVHKRSAHFPSILTRNTLVPREDGTLWNDDLIIDPEYYDHNGHILGSYFLDRGNFNDNFLGSGLNFGWSPNMDRVNEFLDWYNDMTDYAFNRGQDYWQPIFRQIEHLQNVEFNPNAWGTKDHSIDHYAAYIMTEMKIGDKLDFVPGVRYENYHYDMNAWHIRNEIVSSLQLTGEPVNATHDNEFFLPMVQLKYKPFKGLQALLSYTETLQRPAVSQLEPWVIEDNLNFSYNSGNPNLQPEKWTNMDFGLAWHGPKVGLFSVTLFYKEVEDKIANLNWTKLSVDTDIIVGNFQPDQRVDVTEIQNHPYLGIAKGIEVEWQTNFRYLPKPFSYFTLNLNYSYIDNETTYVYTKSENVQVGTGRGNRPIYELRQYDDLVEGPMTNQPSQLFNTSLGFSYKNFETYLSYQYIGEVYLQKAVIPELDAFKNDFSRLDLQAKYRLPIKGMEILFNMSNITDAEEVKYVRGDSRATSIERYGWTADLGLRYTF